MKFDFDVDIDLADRDAALAKLPHTVAGIRRDGELSKHNTGVYFQNIERDPVTDIAAIDYKLAEEQDFFKVDFLNNYAYQDVRSPEHLDQLVATEPMWELLMHEDVVNELYHISSHFEIVQAYEPSSVEELAMILALIRPAKRHLIGKSWDEIRPEIWAKPTNDEYHFKKAHAIAFAMVIVVQLNLLTEAA